MQPPIKPRALIVDDNSSTSLVLEFMLEVLGYDVLCLHDPQKAMEHLRDHRYDVMILDWMMPHIDGITMLPELRARPELDAMQIIMCTARTGTNDKQEALNKGANWFLNKPVSIDVLRACLQSLGALPLAP